MAQAFHLIIPDLRPHPCHSGVLRVSSENCKSAVPSIENANIEAL